MFARRHFRFIVIGGFCPLFAGFDDQRTFFALHNDPKNDSDNLKGLRIGNLRLHGAFAWRHFRFIVIGGFYHL